MPEVNHCYANSQASSMAAWMLLKSAGPLSSTVIVAAVHGIVNSRQMIAVKKVFI